MKLHENASKRSKEVYVGLEKKYNKIHNNKYDYSKAVYIDSKTKMCIICPKHGEFWQNHNKHCTTKQGCPVCGGKQVGNFEEFVSKAKEVHGNKYDYSKVKYEKRHSKVTIVCPVHGEFEQIPTNHLSGKGCDKCAHETLGKTKRTKFDKFISLGKKVHGNKYTYSNYSKMSDFVTITCPIHGDFEQIGSSHISGCGCPKCAEYGFNKDRPAILYYLSIDNGKYYKIGITNRTVELRFSAKDLTKIEIINTWEYEKGEDAYNKEQELLVAYKEYKYTGTNILDSGNSEIFTIDIFSL